MKKVMFTALAFFLRSSSHGKYLENATLPTVPSNLLLSLPHLPEELEYRIIGKHLILRDTGADLIVDFMTDAIK